MKKTTRRKTARPTESVIAHDDPRRVGRRDLDLSSRQTSADAVKDKPNHPTAQQIADNATGPEDPMPLAKTHTVPRHDK